jgi:hypothetical protein
VPRANRTVAPITSLPTDLDGDILVYYLNTLIDQINTSLSDIDITESALRGEDGYTATIGSNLDVQGHTVTNLRSPTQDVEAVSLADLRNYLPAGAIVMWSGTVATIPQGWALCDGTQGTPNLRDRFVVGAGTTYLPGDTGGSATANLAHTHTDGTYAADSQGAHTHSADGTLATDSQGAHTHSADGTLATGTPSATQDVMIGLGVTVASSTHTHDVSGNTSSDGAHTHDVTGNTNSNGAHIHDITGASGSSLSAAQSLLNPYYALCFIMRL